MPPSSQEPGLTIHLLGPVEIHFDGQPLPSLRSRASLWLLALLLLRHPRPLERDWLAGTLWPDSSQEQALANLRQRLAELRRVLGSQSARLQSPTPRTLRFDTLDAEVDLLAFDAAVQRGDPASLEQAIGLYRGPLLDGCLEEWALPERMAREQAYLHALEQLADAALQSAKPAQAAAYLRSVIGIDPLRESAQRALMQAFAAQGDYAAAVQVYRGLRLHLHRELHIDPDAQTSALFQQLRTQSRQRPQAILPPPSPETVSPPPQRLPQPVSSLVGREPEIEEVSACLSSVRLLTLTGTGGVGKTRLAVAVAEAVVDDYPYGVYFVDLAPLSDPALIPQTMASVLEVREQPGKPLLQTLRSFVQSRLLLLVLDNCEHLLERCASVVAALLEGSKHLKVLATSRQSLGITGELVWQVPSLPTPPVPNAAVAAKESVGVWLEYASVQLFVDRAQLVAPAFRLNSANGSWVVAICQQLEGIPLALELAAARLRALSVEQIAARLGDRFGLLTAGSRTALPRQQTLRATIDWSYQLLSDPERRLLRRLSVFAGGWTLEAAEAVCTSKAEGGRMKDESSSIQPSSFILYPLEVLDLLTSLVDKSLVIYAQSSEGEGRYRLLETIRQYTRERLTGSEEWRALQCRHRDYFLALAEVADPKMDGPEQGLWYERLERELDNLRAALKWCQHEQTGAEKGLRLAGSLLSFWDVRSYASEGRAYLKEALEREGVEERTGWRAKALFAAGCLAFHDPGAARALLEQSLALYRELGDKKGIAHSLHKLSLVRCLDDPETARKLGEESLALASELGDSYLIGLALYGLGNAGQAQGDLEAARTLYEEALAIFRELGEPSMIAWSLSWLASVARLQSDHETSKALLEKTLPLWQELGNKRCIAGSLHNLGGIAYDQGNYEAARALYEEALIINRELGNRA